LAHVDALLQRLEVYIVFKIIVNYYLTIIRRKTISRGKQYLPIQEKARRIIGLSKIKRSAISRKEFLKFK